MISLKRYFVLALSLLGWVSGVPGRAQVLDHAVQSRVSFSVIGAPSDGQTVTVSDLQVSVADMTGPVTLNKGAFSAGNAYASAYLQLEPGQLYNVSIAGAKFDYFTVNISAPHGYLIEIDGVLRSQYLVFEAGTYGFRVVPEFGDFRGPAGSASHLLGGKMYWEVSLGSLKNGDPARNLEIIDAATGTWSDLYTPKALVNQAYSADISEYFNPAGVSSPYIAGTLRQVLGNEAYVDINPIDSESYTIDFYARSATQLSGGDFPYTFKRRSDGSTATPFVRYTVAHDTGSPTSATRLKITRIQYAADGSVALTSETSLERTGTPLDSTPNDPEHGFTWVMRDWHDAGQTAKVVERRVWSGSTANRVETVTIEDENSTVSSTVKKTFYLYAWGEELVSITRGTTGDSAHPPVTEDYTYQDNPNDVGDYTYLLTRNTTGGIWEANDYYSYLVAPVSSTMRAPTGFVSRTFRPFKTGTLPTMTSTGTPADWNDASGEVTSYAYESNAPGYRRANSIKTKINNITTAQSDIQYFDPRLVFNAQGISPSPHLINGLDLVVAKRTDKTDAAGSSLGTTTKYYREDVGDDLYRNQIHSVYKPDNTVQMFAYQYGTYDETSGAFTADAATTIPYGPHGAATRIATILGTQTSNSAYSACDTFDGYRLTDTYTGYTDHFYLVPGKSTMTAVIRDASALVRRVETKVWRSGSWQLISYTNFTYDFANRLYSKTSSNGGQYDALYQDSSGNEKGRLQQEKDEAGTVLSYTYDTSGRIYTVTREAKVDGSTTVVPAVVTTIGYNPDGQVTSRAVGTSTESLVYSTGYDDAGRVKTQSEPGSNGTITTNWSYDPVNRSVTATYPDTGTTTETYQNDGALANVTGTAAVSRYFSYDIGTDGLRYAKVSVGSTSSSRISETWRDWLGRPVKTSAPAGFAGGTTQTSLGQTTYDAATGLLTKTSRSGLADMLYKYDDMANLRESGLDLDSSHDLETDGTDRVTDYTQAIDTIDTTSDLWLVTTATTYPKAGSKTVTLTSTRQQRLTGFAASQLGEARSVDVDGNKTATTVTVDRTGKTLTRSTTATGLANAAIELVVNGVSKSSTSFDGLTYSTDYDSQGRTSSSTDPRTGTITTYYKPGSDFVDHVWGPVDSFGDQQYLASYDYDSCGRRNATTSYEYTLGPDGRIGSSPSAIARKSRRDYDTYGQVLHEWGDSSYPIAYGYDPVYRDRTTMTTYRGGTSWTGSAWPTAPGAGDTTTWTFDQATGLVSRKADAAGAHADFEYNIRGQTATRTLARNVTATYAYFGDGTGEAKTGDLKSVSYNDTVPHTPTVSFTYTRLGQTDTVTDATGTRDFVYDPSHLNRLSTEALDTGFYAGRLFTSRYEDTNPPASTFNGYTTGQVAGASSGFTLGVPTNPARDLVETLTHANSGRLAGVSASTVGGAVRDFVYAYQANSALVSGYQAAGLGGGTFSVSRDFEGARDLVSRIEAKWGTTSITRFDLAHNSLGQLVTANQSGTAYADYYSGTSYGSVYNYYAYNGRGEMRTSVMARGASSASQAPPASADQLPGRRFEYRYDNAGNRVTTGPVDPDTPSDPAQVAQHDQLVAAFDQTYSPNRLNQYDSKTNKVVHVLGSATANASVSVTGAAVTKLDRNFAADFVPTGGAASQGSLGVVAVTSGTSAVAKAVSRNFFAPPATQTLVHDADGNLTSDGLWTYQWDAENRLVQVTSTLPPNQGFTRLQLNFKYDYLGRRAEKQVFNLDLSTTVPSLDHRYLYQGSALVAETTAAGAMVRSYVWGVDVSGSLSAAGGAGALVEVIYYNANNTTTAYFPSTDANGNIVSLTQENGTLAAVYEYSPFGELLRSEKLDPAVTDQPFRFSSQYTDDETGLVYYGARYYSPALGRFINRDPAEETGGINLYGFCRNDGINHIDVGGQGVLGDVLNWLLGTTGNDNSGSPNEGNRGGSNPPLPPSDGGGGSDYSIFYGGDFVDGEAVKPSVADNARFRTITDFDRRNVRIRVVQSPQSDDEIFTGASGLQAVSSDTAKRIWANASPPDLTPLPDDDEPINHFDGIQRLIQVKAEFIKRHDEILLAQAGLDAVILTEKLYAELAGNLVGGEVAVYYVVRGVRYVVLLRTAVNVTRAAEAAAAATEGTGIARVMAGQGRKIAVIGRSMKYVRETAAVLKKAGTEVELFDGPIVSDAARAEWDQLVGGLKAGERLSEAQLRATKMFQENLAWAQKLVRDGYTVIDAGAPAGSSSSVFYEMEKLVIFGDGL